MDRDFQSNKTGNIKSLGILIYSLAGGGAERVVSYLLAYCAENKIKAHLILMNTTIKYDIPDEVEIHYIETSNSAEKGIKKALKIPFLAYKYGRLVKKLKISHSLSFLTRPSFINIISREFTNHKFKVITNERAFPSLQYGYRNFQSYFNKTLIRMLYKRSDRVISNSYGNLDDLLKNFNVPTEKTYTIHNPIDLSKIEKIDGLRGFYNEKHFNLITIGRLDHGKNHNLLIDAIYKANNNLLRLYILGTGELENELKLKVEKLKLEEQVIFMGFDSNPYKFLKSADLFIFGSNHEGFPNVLLEAMSCGLPILSTNCKSGPSEILELQKEKDDIMKTDYGILVPVKNVELMTKGITYFISNKEYQETCKNNVLKRVEDFEKIKILKKYIDIIKSVN